MDLLYGSIRTVRTGKRFLPGVSEDVSLEVIFNGGVVGTVGAGKRPLPSVYPGVADEVGLDHGGVGAVGAAVHLAAVAPRRSPPSPALQTHL